MGLTKTIPDPQAPGDIDAYAKYVNFNINTDELIVTLSVAIYRNKLARDTLDSNGKPLYKPIRYETYSTNLNGSYGPDGNRLEGGPTFLDFAQADNSNPQGTGSQIYNFLKAFTSWAGSTDA